MSNIRSPSDRFTVSYLRVKEVLLGEDLVTIVDIGSHTTAAG
jgi:hypothetical protein